MFARLAATTVALMALTSGVSAQTTQTTLPATTGTSSTTSAPTTKPTTSAVYHYSYTVCYQTYSVAAEGSIVSAPIPSGFPAPDGAVCYRVYPTGGGVASQPYTTIRKTSAASPSPGVTIIPAPNFGENGNPATGSSHSGGTDVRTIVGAAVGSVLGLGLIAAAVLFLRKRKSKKDRSWVNRPGGWVQEEKRHSDNIILKDRNSKDSVQLHGRPTEV